MELPKRIQLSKDGVLSIDWDGGDCARIPISVLRSHCPCATCREERLKPPDPFRVLQPKEMEPLRLVRMDPIGLYAYRMVWSDGHEAGIYSLDMLRGIA